MIWVGIAHSILIFLCLVPNQPDTKKFISYGMYLIDSKCYCRVASRNKIIAIDDI